MMLHRAAYIFVAAPAAVTVLTPVLRFALSQVDDYGTEIAAQSLTMGRSNAVSTPASIGTRRVLTRCRDAPRLSLNGSKAVTAA